VVHSIFVLNVSDVKFGFLHRVLYNVGMDGTDGEQIAAVLESAATRRTASHLWPEPTSAPVLT
jgi:hypothetical protein